MPAAHIVLERAGLSFADVDAITMHDPFAVNDLWFSQQTGIAPERINERGASLIFGHPQGPTDARLPAGRGAPNSGRFILTSIRQWTREVVEAANRKQTVRRHKRVGGLLWALTPTTRTPQH
jgi:hypothetical protein